MKNLEIVQILNNIADILEIQGVEFKPNAYRRAARSIEGLAEDIAEVAGRGELRNIPGVGESIAEKIEEFIKTGKLRYYEQLKKQVKVNVEELNAIPTLGPKKIKLLYEKLHITDVADLKKALLKKKLQTLPGFGDETVKNLQKGIELLEKRPQRFLYAQALPLALDIARKLRQSKAVEKVDIAGSFRRGKETVGDLDFLAISKKPEEVMQRFTSLPDIDTVLAQGTTRGSVRFRNGLQADLRVLKEKEFGSALLYFTGSKDHNIELRKLAISKKWTLSEYGLFRVKSQKSKISGELEPTVQTNKKWLAGRTEEEVYKKLGLSFIEPELRENTGEIAAAQQKKLPKLITAKDVQGMFHNHTTWSDGNASVLEMAKKAEELQFRFLSFNDHYGHIGITNPLNERRLAGYLKAIEQAQKKTNVRLFSGVEIDIQKDGSLPLSRKKLQELDVVIASVHISTKMPEKEMTQRVVSALENYPVNILGHPTDRLLMQREPLALNLEKVFATAKRQNVFLEVNGSPGRMDLPGEQVKAALHAGCKIALSLDAHDPNHLGYGPFALQMARRGWAQKKDVLNCWALPKMEKALRK
ncbi:MAG: DNA polymerase/3'-5' exonuclease PolX [Nanoarchaeota archaeon]|nr:DNA polymerase/3'-5' exonuclease PolX [Nanoarchaeota archaeon]